MLGLTKQVKAYFDDDDTHRYDDVNGITLQDVYRDREYADVEPEFGFDDFE